MQKILFEFKNRWFDKMKVTSWKELKSKYLSKIMLNFSLKSKRTYTLRYLQKVEGKKNLKQKTSFGSIRNELSKTNQSRSIQSKE